MHLSQIPLLILTLFAHILYAIPFDAENYNDTMVQPVSYGVYRVRNSKT